MNRFNGVAIVLLLAVGLAGCQVSTRISKLINSGSNPSQKSNSNKKGKAQASPSEQTTLAAPPAQPVATAESTQAFVQNQSGSAVQPTQEPSGAIALKIEGKVNTPESWTSSEIRAMPVLRVEAKNAKGKNEKYTGVAINSLLNMAGLKPDAKTVVFIGSDGSRAEIPLDTIKNCQNCIISYRKSGSFNNLMPGMPATDEVKGVIDIQIQ